jgi:multidrug efflux pump subunit AcrA (membrane-fusion protein)
MKGRHLLLPGGLTLALCGAVTERTLGPSSHVPATRAEAGEVGGKVIAEGVVAAIAGVSELRARIDGRVRGVRVREGDRVSAGQVLAEIEAEDLLLESESARADLRALEAREQALRRGSRPEDVARTAAALEAANASVALAEDRARRASTLQEYGAAAENGVVEAQSLLAQARAQAAQVRAQHAQTVKGSRAEDISASHGLAEAARARAARAQLHYSWSKIVASSDGVIVGRHIDDGDTVFANPVATVLFEIADPTHTELMVEVDESDVGRIEPDLQVAVTWPGGKKHITTGQVDRIGPRLRERTIGATSARLRAQTHVRPIWVRWSNTHEAALPLGTRLEAAIELPTKPVNVRVPRAAVQVRDGIATLRVPGLLFSKRVPVQLGVTDDQYVEVFGVDPNTEIVAQGTSE